MFRGPKSKTWHGLQLRNEWPVIILLALIFHEVLSEIIGRLKIINVGQHIPVAWQKVDYGQIRSSDNFFKVTLGLIQENQQGQGCPSLKTGVLPKKWVLAKNKSGQAHLILRYMTVQTNLNKTIYMIRPLQKFKYLL